MRIDFAHAVEPGRSASRSASRGERSRAPLNKYTPTDASPVDENANPRAALPARAASAARRPAGNDAAVQSRVQARDARAADALALERERRTIK